MRLGIVGDIHGHRKELEEILTKVAQCQVDRIVLLGDLMDRGPDCLGCVGVAREWQFTARCGQTRKLDVVMGNHEDAYVRAWKRLPKPGQRDIASPGCWNTARALDNSTLEWLASLPYVIEEPRLGVLCLHGGVDDDMIVRSDLDERVARIRFLDQSGRGLTNPFDRTRPHWSDRYDGRFGFVVYGHQSWQNPRLSKFALGLDGEGWQRVHAAVLTNETESGLRVSKTLTVNYQDDMWQKFMTRTERWTRQTPHSKNSKSTRRPSARERRAERQRKLFGW